MTNFSLVKRNIGFLVMKKEDDLAEKMRKFKEFYKKSDI